MPADLAVGITAGIRPGLERLVPRIERRIVLNVRERAIGRV